MSTGNRNISSIDTGSRLVSIAEAKAIAKGVVESLSISISIGSSQQSRYNDQKFHVE